MSNKQNKISDEAKAFFKKCLNEEPIIASNAHQWFFTGDVFFIVGGNHRINGTFEFLSGDKDLMSKFNYVYSVAYNKNKKNALELFKVDGTCMHVYQDDVHMLKELTKLGFQKVGLIKVPDNKKCYEMAYFKEKLRLPDNYDVDENVIYF